jgi:ubiquinone/menaquinone biosynthesis C-methylase UbiE
MSDANLNDAQVAADYDLIYADRDTQVDRLVQIMNGHLPVVPDGRLLDCTCGSGLSLDAAHRIGWAVTGADSSPAMIQRARLRLPDVEYTTIDVRSLDQVFDARFDAVISVGNTLPMLAPGQLPMALQSMRRCLKSRGALMVAIRDFSDRIKSGVWRDDPVARVQARFVHQGDDSIVYALDISDSSGERTHELTLHPISPLALGGGGAGGRLPGHPRQPDGRTGRDRGHSDLTTPGVG